MIHNNKKNHQGFTLLELSIVLVIIGLLAGGVLVGQDMIKAAEIRATVSQYEKYNTAINTFRTKYNGLPGDISYTNAQAFGLCPGGVSANCIQVASLINNGRGQGDANGVIEDAYASGTDNSNAFEGETVLLWQQLSLAGLVDGSFGNAMSPTGGIAAGSDLTRYFPSAKVGRGNMWLAGSSRGTNYFVLVGLNPQTAATSVQLTPIETYNIDLKLDDGIPNTGAVQARNNEANTVGADTLVGPLAFQPLNTNNAAGNVLNNVTGNCLKNAPSYTATDNTYALTLTQPLCALRLRMM